ncbi:MOSC domain-containing protein [Phlyctema vagabunda]|uniref:MOSC domain-containing protein n=1 Tax=Phlyctema vagabunda TaxID=108571 RepID=A0ABR4PGW4_9HELO
MVLYIPPDLNTPFEKATIRELRIGKLKPYKGLSITSGILKEPRDDAVFTNMTGLDGDEHDLTFHGGVDKAVHQYCSLHYSSWRSEFPASAELFTVGGFGENIVSEAMNERNVCIGDIIQIGSSEDGCLLQVSLPRQPCYKLNHRFEIKGFASHTWKNSRTGWYYRVLKEGRMRRGDPIVLVDRLHPRWTIERIQEYLHRDGSSDIPVLKELLAIPEFGAECKRHFKHLIEIAETANEAKEPEIFSDFKLVEKIPQTPRITSFVFEATNPEDSAEDIIPGGHVRLKLPNGLLRSYSLVDGTMHKFQLAIALEDQSRGGSSYLHNTLKIRDTVQVGKATRSVPIVEGASNHIFIVGGIGITAFLPITKVFSRINFNYEFYYAVRSEEETPFKLELSAMQGNLTIYDGSKSQRMDIPSIISNRKWNSHVYVCGPQKMVDAVRACNISDDEVHYEAFQAVRGGDPFTFSLKKDEDENAESRKRVFQVKEHETLLEVIRKQGLEVDSSCEVGNCASCKVDVCAGKVEHRGSALSEKDKKGALLSCVSRGIGHLVIDF